LLWGLPVATSPAIPVGKFLTGAFLTHVLFVDRMSSMVEVSTEHADYFVRRLAAILAVERCSLIVTRQDAVVYGSF
jgi:HK97 family phage major capsid protein